MRQHRLHQRLGAAVMRGRHGKHRETQRRRNPRFSRPTPADRPCWRPRPRGGPPCAAGAPPPGPGLQARLEVHHQDHRRRILDGRPDLLRRGLQDLVAGLRPVHQRQAAGIHHLEALAQPFRARHQAVARHAFLRVHDRQPAPHQPVEQRGLAHVGPAHDRHDPLGLGFSCHRQSCPFRKSNIQYSIFNVQCSSGAARSGCSLEDWILIIGYWILSFSTGRSSCR